MEQKFNRSFLPIIIAGFILVIFGSFFGGMYYGKAGSSKTIDTLGKDRQDQFQQNGNRSGGFGRMLGGRPFLGKVTEISGKTITLALENDGGTKSVVVADNTNITDNDADAVLTNIKNGDTLMVTGITNTDSSIKAQMIKINPTVGSPPNTDSPQ